MKFVIITENKSWTTTAIVVQETRASVVLDALIASDPDGMWQITSIPLSAEEVEDTLDEWERDGF